MIRSVVGCIREDKSNSLVHTDFPLPLGAETSFENGCLKVILVDLAAGGKGSIYFSFIWTLSLCLSMTSRLIKPW